MEGASGKIYDYSLDKVIKVSKRKNNNFEYKIHILAEELTQDLRVLRVPKIFERVSQRAYVMEKIQLSPVIYTDELLTELSILYKRMIEKGFFPNDFELYQQPDNSVILLDFDKFGVIFEEKIRVCGSVVLTVEQAFITPKLDQEFSLRLKSLVFFYHLRLIIIVILCQNILYLILRHELLKRQPQKFNQNLRVI